MTRTVQQQKQLRRSNRSVARRITSTVAEVNQQEENPQEEEVNQADNQEDAE